MMTFRKLSMAGMIAALGLSAAPVFADGISAGGYHAVRVDEGSVKGLGDGTYGQLGTNPAGAPAIVAGLSGISDVAAGGFSTLALKSDGTVWFLGESTLQHTTPHGTPSPASTPLQVAGLSGIDAIAAGHRHFLALDTDTGNLYAWGHNGSGQIGNGGLIDVDTPVVVLTGVSAISAGDGFSLAVKTDHTLWAWGRNSHGQLGLGDTADRLSPTQVPGIATAAAVAAGGQHTLILLADGSVLTTGDNGFGQLGLGTTTNSTTPAAVTGLSGISEVSAGYFHSAAFGNGGQVSVWGRNFEGQCAGGGSSPVNYGSPQTLTGLAATPIGIECGYHFTLIEFADGSVAGTGSNSDGQLDGTSVADQDDSRKILAPQTVPLSPDNTPPSPDPMSFSTAPTAFGAGAITMTASTATDPGGVEYFFEWLSGGGNDSGWQDSPTYTDTGLIPEREYTYRVKARDKSPGRNETGFSAPASATVIREALITITNPSFETDENTEATGAFASGTRGNFGGELTGWIGKSGAASEVSVGWKDIPAASLHPFPQVGDQESQALSLQSGSSVLNTTGTAWSSLSAGDQLTLTISLGMRTAALNWNEKTFFGLTDGDADLASIGLSDTVANSGLIANNPATGTQNGDGSFTDVSFTYTVLAGDLTRNGNIGILIYSEGTGGSGAANQSFFDNVRLNQIAVTANDFAAYISDPAFGLARSDQGLGEDPDGDRISNGLEAWFGTHPGEFNAAITNLSSDGITMTFTHPQNPTPPSDLTGFYQWSSNLTDWYAGDGVDGQQGGSTVAITPMTDGAATSVTATPSREPEKLFLRVGVNQN